MKPAGSILIAIFVIATASDASSQSAAAQPAVEKAPVQIVSHKIGLDYYPMLDRPSLTSQQMSAENGDVPITENERLARQQRNRSNKNIAAPIAPEEQRSQGRLRSYTRVIDNAQLVQVVIKNTETKPIKAVDWDFAFPRYENGQLLSRFSVKSKAEIKPGGKKTLKFTLPPGAKKCEVVRVISEGNEGGQAEKFNTFEAVCGQGFKDPSLLKQKQETITIKRIEYADGSVWRKPE